MLRDEGETYARKLNEAGGEVMAVRYNGLIHDWGQVLNHRVLEPLRAPLVFLVGEVCSAMAALATRERRVP